MANKKNRKSRANKSTTMQKYSDANNLATTLQQKRQTTETRQLQKLSSNNNKLQSRNCRHK